MSLSWTLPLALILTITPAAGSILLSEDFESTFPAPNWIGDFSGAVVADPLNSSNKVLHFTSYGSGGDLFSKSLTYPLGTTVRVDFDFLNTGAQANNTGAYVGTNHGCCSFNQEDWHFPNLSATPGVWTHFSAEFTVFDPSSLGTFNLKLEQGAGSTAAGTAFFDNIVVQTIPEPASCALIALGLIFLGRRGAGNPACSRLSGGSDPTPPVR